ncbi:MAG: hypothetical protein M3R17_04840 [Bacteroidota bacterium]|nr:hypothetical protein [Bacteroidota bacterium]
MKAALNEIVKAATLDASDSIPAFCSGMDSLVSQYKEIMSQLSTFESYENPQIVFSTQPLVIDADGDCEIAFRAVDASLERLKQKMEAEVRKELQLASH